MTKGKMMGITLENMPVKIDDSYKKAFGYREESDSASEQLGTKLMGIVGHCPSCGSPVYGCTMIAKDETPDTKHSCDCWRRQGVMKQKEEGMEHQTKANPP